MAELLEAVLAPDRRAAAAEEQRKRRAAAEHVTARTAAEANYLYGLARADLALAMPAGEAALAALAEGYALQGRFGEAADVEPDEAVRDIYEAKAAAIARAGEYTCSCPAVTVTPSRHDAKGVRAPTRHTVERVFDGAKFYTISKCRACGALSAEEG